MLRWDLIRNSREQSKLACVTSFRTLQKVIDYHMGWSSKLGATMGGGGVNPGVGLLIPGSHPVDRDVKAP